ncbi:MAG: DNA replication/repair protein RecF [Chloroflexota bacterium]|nr:DNA replication/repair protein RecF [Chloroflexota bacterium]
MYIKHLSLVNFRNYTSLELDLPPHITVFQGDNAQGKSNLLEAIYILATTRSPHASNEREFINWSAYSDELPACRLVADVQRAGDDICLEIALMSRTIAPSEARGSLSLWNTTARALPIQKRIRVNGIVQRAIDFVGKLNVVTFSTQDINLIAGEPALRRRYLDITNSQMDSQYLQQLQRYQRVLWQRNRLLRLISDKKASLDELSFWDQELVQAGCYLIVQRERMVSALEYLAQNIHDKLSADQGTLKLLYLRSIDKECGDSDFQSKETVEIFWGALHAARDKEIAHGMSLVGPHRDTIRFIDDNVDLGIYGSRGQQRTVALSLKLAEAKLMLNRTGEHPVLLLDDVLSELDRQRRNYVLRLVTEYQQVLMTTTDLDHFTADFLAQAETFRVIRGSINPISG